MPRRAESPVLPPAPGALPGLGHVLPLLRAPLPFITSLSALGDVVKVRIAHMPAYVVTDPELVRRVLVTSDHDFTQGRVYEKLAQFLGEGVGTASGRKHRRLRRLIQPAFHRDRIAEYADTMRAAAESTVAGWRPGQRIRVDSAMNDMALKAVTACLFATEMTPRASAEFRESILTLFHGAVLRTLLPTAWEKLPTPGNRRYRRAITAANRVIDETITLYRAPGPRRNDMLTLLLDSRDDDGDALTDQQIRDQVITFLFAGVETTGATVAWALHELGRHPEAEKRLHEELDAVLGGRPPTWQDLCALPYTGRVVTETLRLHAPWLILRRTLHPVRLGDVTLPEGAEVVYSPYGLQRDPRHFPDPERFDPDRWLPERNAAGPRGAYVPFGAGVHQCIGDAFALTEITIALAVICSHWRMRPRPGVPVREVAAATTHPKGLTMTAEPRFP
ncbi:cytochrome P450 [Streptomyces sp. NPDC053079]|uniref:cytochrome P450 n=1 Tax=Streptomyces sp. NPDC053079 TaxID=3365697 RepID=UPI0037D905E1